METRNGPACSLHCPPILGCPRAAPPHLSAPDREPRDQCPLPREVNGAGIRGTGREQWLGAVANHQTSLKAPIRASPVLHFLSSVCPRRARNTAHNSSLGGRSCPDSCGAAAAMNGSRLPQSPGGRGARGGPEAQGLAGTMARPGPAVAEAGAAADGEGWGTGAKLGTKGPFSRLAGGCLHRCGSGGTALPRAGGRGAASAARRSWSGPGRQGGQRQGWAPLISRASGDHPHTSSWFWAACPHTGPSPGLGPSTHHRLSSLPGAEPSHPDLPGPATPGRQGRTEAGTEAFPTPELGSMSFPSSSSLAHWKLPESTQARQHLGPPCVLGFTGARHRHNRGMCHVGGVTARLPTTWTNWVGPPFWRSVGSPRREQGPLLLEGKRLGTDMAIAPCPMPLRPCAAPKASPQLMQPRTCSRPRQPLTLTSPDISCPTPSSTGFPAQPRSACNGSHCSPAVTGYAAPGPTVPGSVLDPPGALAVCTPEHSEGGRHCPHGNGGECEGLACGPHRCAAPQQAPIPGCGRALLMLFLGWVLTPRGGEASSHPALKGPE